MALATSTDRQMIAEKVKGKEFVLEFFREIVGGDEVKDGKPNPEIFLKAAEKINVPPAACLAFEDSTVGVKV